MSILFNEPDGDEEIVAGEVDFSMDVIPVNPMVKATDLVTQLNDLSAVLDAHMSGNMTMQQAALYRNIESMGVDAFCDLYTGKAEDYVMQGFPDDGNTVAVGAAGVAVLGALAMLIWKIRKWWKNRGDNTAEECEEALQKSIGERKKMDSEIDSLKKALEDAKNGDVEKMRALNKRARTKLAGIYPLDKPKQRLFADLAHGNLKLTDALVAIEYLESIVNTMNETSRDILAKRYKAVDDHCSKYLGQLNGVMKHLQGHSHHPVDTSSSMDNLKKVSSQIKDWAEIAMSSSLDNRVPIKDFKVNASDSDFSSRLKLIKASCKLVDVDVAEKLKKEAGVLSKLSSEYRESYKKLAKMEAIQQLVMRVINEVVCKGGVQLIDVMSRMELVKTLEECIDATKNA